MAEVKPGRTIRPESNITVISCFNAHQSNAESSRHLLSVLRKAIQADSERPLLIAPPCILVISRCYSPGPRRVVPVRPVLLLRIWPYLYTPDLHCKLN